MITLQYRIKTGHKLNLKKPKRYTEKLQWYKLYYRNPLMIQCADKFDVREYIASKGLVELLVSCFGVFDSVDQIPWDMLPDQFVIKDTLGGGGNFVVVVKDKKATNLNMLKNMVAKWATINFHKKNGGREWPYYSGKKHRLLIEEYIEQPNGDLADYKFFCFNGKMAFFYVRTGYLNNHNDGKSTFYKRDCQPLIGVGMDCLGIAENPTVLPSNINKMIQFAEILSKDFPHVRVDLYNLNGRIVFGELTFFTASGYMKFFPDEFDYTLGDEFILPQKTEARA